jgi:hypothetical protein
MLGTFANNGVELYTPWTWKTGMWETLHLFSRYAKNQSITSISTLENMVSGYATLSENADSMTMILVNRDLSSTHKVTVNLSGFSVPDGTYNTLQLAALPAEETFISHTSNALKKNTITVSGNSFSIVIPPVSTTAVILKATASAVDNPHILTTNIALFPNPVKECLNIVIGSHIQAQTEIAVHSQDGKLVVTSNIDYDGSTPMKINIDKLVNGMYFLKIRNADFSGTKKFWIKR